MFPQQVDTKGMHPEIRARFMPAAHGAKVFNVNAETFSLLVNFVMHHDHAEAFLELLAKSAPRPFPSVAISFTNFGKDRWGNRRDMMLLLAPADWAFYAAINREGPGKDAFAASSNNGDAPFFLIDGRPSPDSEEAEKLFAPLRLTTIVLFFLMAHAPEVLRHKTVSARRGMHGNRAIRYPEHHVLTLDLDKAREALVRLDNAHRYREPPRRHAVRAFYRVRGATPGCGCKRDPEAWRTLASDDNGIVSRAECVRCGAKKTLIPPHYRGDAGKGFVTKDYQT